MMKKLLLSVFMIMVMAFSVSAFTITNNNPNIDIIGDNDGDSISGTVTINTNDEISNISVLGTTSTIEFDDFNASVIFSPGSTIVAPNSTQVFTYSFIIPEDVAGEQSGIIAFTAGSDVQNATVTIDVIQLKLKDLDVKVAGDRDNNIHDESDGYTIDAKAEPGDEVTFYLKLENLYSGDDEDDSIYGLDGEVEIEDITVEIIIENIDDGDDLEKDIKVDDIDEDEDESISITFTVPKKAESDEYTITLEIEAEDANGNEITISKEFGLEVDRESHKVDIDNAYFTQSVISCDRSTSLKVDIINLGEKSEDEVKVTVINSALGINLAESRISLDDDPDDDDNDLTLSFPIAVKDSVIAGTYMVDIRTYWDSNRASDAMKLPLEISNCVSAPVVEDDEEEVEVVIQPQVSDDEEDEELDAAAEPVVTSGSASKVKGAFTDSVWFIVLLVLGNIAIVGIAVWLIAKFLTK